VKLPVRPLNLTMNSWFCSNSPQRRSRDVKLFRLACWRLASFLAFLPGAVGLLGSPHAAWQLDPALFQEMRWRSIGPFRGGRALAVTGIRGQPDVYYFGAVDGGVWRTYDAGRTWHPIFDSQSIGSIGAIAAAPSNPQVLYVGTGEADMRSDISYGNGIYKSGDGGGTWTHVGLEDSRQIGRILVDPRNSEKVFVAALGHAYGPNAQRGVFRSDDGGKTWQQVLFRDENTGAIDLAFEPGNPAVIYAALWQTRRPPWNIYPPSNGPGSGLYRSNDGGDHWEHLTGHGLPAEGLGRIGIAVAPGRPQRIYLIADAKEGGLYRSDDAGQSWERMSQDKRLWGRGWYFCEVSADPKDPDTVYVPNTSLYRSRDGGKNFTAIKGAPGGDDYHVLWIDPDEPERMVLGSDQGVIVTRNGGGTWSSWYNQPTGQFYHVATDKRFPYWVYGAQQDSGAAATLSRSSYRAINHHDWRPMEAGDENGYIAPDPLHPGIVYGGAVSRQNLVNQQIVEIPPTLAHPGQFRRSITAPLVFSPLDSHLLYFGSQVLFRTADAGNSWQIISPDLSRENPGVPPNLDTPAAEDAPVDKRRGVINTIGPSAVQAGEIWAGTDDGLIYLTRNEGKSWKNVTPPVLTPWSNVTHIEPSHFSAGTAYAALDRHRLDDLHAYLYRTRDFGDTWKQVSSGIPEGNFLNCVREDPVRKGLLYACTELGVFVSFNDGDDWQSLRLNLPVTSVRDLVVQGSDLVIGTHGRSFWVLDDVTPLRQISEQIVSSNVWLLEPRTAYRSRPGSDQGTPVPMGEPLADNAPDGAVLHYYLRENSTAPVELEFADSKGNLVRRFASGEELPKTDPNEIDIPAYWVHDETPLAATAGMHQFVWDLHYPLPNSIRRSFDAPLGPWAVPGRYTVKLTVNGKSMSQPLVIKMDPRVLTPQDDLVREFGAARKLAARLGEVSGASQLAQDLNRQIDARAQDVSGDAGLAKAFAELRGRISELLGTHEDEFGLAGLSEPDGAASLDKVSRALTALLAIVEGADSAPTTDAERAIRQWNSASKNVLARWRSLEDIGKRINSRLERLSLQPLRTGEYERKYPP
jgi:photosystem II stability/assembly factor-like uncharacterized protein